MENAPEIKASLLIVEDEEAVRESLRAVLECDGYHCDGAENGTRALEMVTQQFYNIMLVDYRLPDMNGLEFHKAGPGHFKRFHPAHPFTGLFVP